MDEFRAKVTAVMEQHPDGWIIDGDYKRPMKDLISGAATDIICKSPHTVFEARRGHIDTAQGSTRRSSCTFRASCSARSSACSGSRRRAPRAASRSGRSASRARGSSGGPSRTTALSGSGTAREWGVENGGKLRRLGGWGGALGAWQREVGALAASRQ